MNIIDAKLYFSSRFASNKKLMNQRDGFNTPCVNAKRFITMFARLTFIMSKHVFSFFSTKWQRAGSEDVNSNTKYSNYNQSCISDALKTENWKIRPLKLGKQNLHQFFKKFSHSFAIYKCTFLNIFRALS